MKFRGRTTNSPAAKAGNENQVTEALLPGTSRRFLRNLRLCFRPQVTPMSILRTNMAYQRNLNSVFTADLRCVDQLDVEPSCIFTDYRRLQLFRRRKQILFASHPHTPRAARVNYGQYVSITQASLALHLFYLCHETDTAAIVAVFFAATRDDFAASEAQVVRLIISFFR